MSEDLFYTELPSFDKFTDLTNEGFYKPLPEDWCVVVTDIEGSTKAIEAGRYKDVNLVGAATIAAARNALSGQDIPFVFGGDGASFAFHQKHRSKIEAAMRGLQNMATENFSLSLRIGLVPVKELYAADAKLEVARYELIAGRHLALFNGGGLAVAEKWIKQMNSSYLIQPLAGCSANIDGLSCRWNSIPNIRGVIMSLIIQKQTEQANAVYYEVLSNLNRLCGGNMDAVNPVNIPSLSYQSIRECLFLENRLHLPKWTLKHFLRIFEITACVCIFRFKVPPLIIDPDRYTKSMRAHADYRKFDDAIRMVIDVSETQKVAIHNYLKTLHDSGLIYYGIHTSRDSLMTCYVDDIHDGNHIHFIDGADGGYAMAAKQLKAQVRSR